MASPADRTDVTVLKIPIRQTESNGSSPDLTMLVVWVVLVVLLHAGVFFWCVRLRQSSSDCRRRRISRLRTMTSNSNQPGFATTTYVVRPSGITIAVSTMNPATPHMAAVAAAEAAQAQHSGQSRYCVKLEGFDAPLEVGDESCAICLSPLAEQRVSKASCRHLIHTSCYNSWLAKDSKRACPICRQPVDRSISPPQPS